MPISQEILERMATRFNRFAESIREIQYIGEIARVGYAACAHDEIMRGLGFQIHALALKHAEDHSPQLLPLSYMLTVRVSTHLEAFVHDMVRIGIAGRLVRSDLPENIKIPIRYAANPESEDWLEGIYKHLQYSVSGNAKYGIGRYIKLLSFVSIVSQANSDCRAMIEKCNNYRNNIVHAEGVIDRNLVSKYDNLTEGEKLLIQMSDVRVFFAAASWFASDIIINAGVADILPNEQRRLMIEYRLMSEHLVLYTEDEERTSYMYNRDRFTDARKYAALHADRFS